MSSGHKAALARGRAESASVRHYLEALETSRTPSGAAKPHPGHSIIDKRLAAIENQLAAADALTKLHLLQERKDLVDERSSYSGRPGRASSAAGEGNSSRWCKAYGAERKGLSPTAGHLAAVLHSADISTPGLSQGYRTAPSVAGRDEDQFGTVLTGGGRHPSDRRRPARRTRPLGATPSGFLRCGSAARCVTPLPRRTIRSGSATRHTQSSPHLDRLEPRRPPGPPHPLSAAGTDRASTLRPAPESGLRLSKARRPPGRRARWMAARVACHSPSSLMICAT